MKQKAMMWSYVIDVVDAPKMLLSIINAWTRNYPILHFHIKSKAIEKAEYTGLNDVALSMGFEMKQQSSLTNHDYY